MNTTNRHSFHRTAVTLLNILLITAVLSGCRTAMVTEAPFIDLAGTSWLLIEMDGEPLPHDFAPRELISLSFSEMESSAHGFSGCNRYGGIFEQEGSSLNFGNLRSTRMACPNVEMKVEYRFLETLGSVNSHRLRDGRLVLLANGGERLAFVPAP